MSPSQYRTPLSIPTLSEAIGDRWRRLLGVKRRLYFMRAFVDELQRVTRKKSFTIRNDVVWNMVLDARDKCVIDLYSLTVEMRHGLGDAKKVSRDRQNRKANGLFRLLRDTYRIQLSRKYVGDGSDDSHLHRVLAAGREAAFTKLFPGCATDVPSETDVEGLCERLRLQMEHLGRDRNKNRAHVHEGDLGTVKMLSIEELDELFTYCEDLIDNLGSIGLGTSYARTDMNSASVEKTATDLVELILFRHAKDLAKLFLNHTREEIYDELHALDDAGPAQNQAGHPINFNDRQFDMRFREFLRMINQSDE